jgi:subtilisin family serine protease
MFERLLRKCWNSEIVTVVAAGNDGRNEGVLNDNVPTALGNVSNELITVGGINLDGSLWPETTIDDGSGGSMTVSLVASDVLCAASEGTDRTDTRHGTSFAAPQVAGLAAYFMSLPSLQGTLRPPKTPLKVKNYIVNAAFKRGKAGAAERNPLAAYNLAEDAVCRRFEKRGDIEKRELSRRDRPDFETIMMSGTIVSNCSRPWRG